MREQKRRFDLLIAAATVLCLIVALPVHAQMPGTVGAVQAPDPLKGLKLALQDAGAPALTSDQEQQINALLKAFIDAHKPAQNAALQSAHKELETAILNSDTAGAAAQAGVIASQTGTEMSARLKDQANLAIDILRVLRSDQVSLLAKRIGSRGLVQLLQSVGMPGMAGPGMRPGMGPGIGPGMGPGIGGMRPDAPRVP